MEIGELCEQLNRVRTMLQEQRTTLDAMPAIECRVFKALQTFICSTSWRRKKRSQGISQQVLVDDIVAWYGHSSCSRYIPYRMYINMYIPFTV
jgi:hypothetical protein